MPERLPKNSCDTHLHVFGDAKAYPVGNPNALYQPPQDCDVAAMQALHDAMGIERAVLVQPTIYGSDHSLLHDVLKAAPKGKYRGVAIVDDSVSDAELQRLNDVGVRGARFNFGGAFKLAPSTAGLRRTLDRVRELGWFVKVFGFGDDFLAVGVICAGSSRPPWSTTWPGWTRSAGRRRRSSGCILDLLEKGELVDRAVERRSALADWRAVG